MTDTTDVQQTGGALDGQTVVVIGGSQGIGLETARMARAVGADVILTARNAERLAQAAADVGAVSTAAFDATDEDRLLEFLGGLPAPVDHIMVTAGGSYYSTLPELDLQQVRRAFQEHVAVTFTVAKASIGLVRPGGSLTFMTGTAARHPAPGLSVAGFFAVGLQQTIADVALELAPIRANLIAAGFVDTPLSARLLGADLDARRQQLAETLPIRRVVTAADVAALALHLMTNSALTGATYDVDGGQQLLVER
jgi:NAD(P)-dependent dehydrogenase (short-subunit alcohol dehydrogenase family)